MGRTVFQPCTKKTKNRLLGVLVLRGVQGKPHVTQGFARAVGYERFGASLSVLLIFCAFVGKCSFTYYGLHIALAFSKYLEISRVFTFDVEKSLFHDVLWS